MTVDVVPARSIPAWAGEPVTIPAARRLYPHVGLLGDLGRSIPAWAGEPSIAQEVTINPRVGGGTVLLASILAANPRVGGGT